MLGTVLRDGDKTVKNQKKQQKLYVYKSVILLHLVFFFFLCEIEYNFQSLQLQPQQQLR